MAPAAGRGRRGAGEQRAADACGQPRIHPAQPSRRGSALSGREQWRFRALRESADGALQALRRSTGPSTLRRPAATRSSRSPNILRHLTSRGGALSPRRARSRACQKCRVMGAWCKQFIEETSVRKQHAAAPVGSGCPRCLFDLQAARFDQGCLVRVSALSMKLPHSSGVITKASTPQHPQAGPAVLLLVALCASRS